MRYFIDCHNAKVKYDGKNRWLYVGKKWVKSGEKCENCRSARELTEAEFFLEMI